ncbi:hypothetical protein C8Q77DRAFT_1158039 [Trametes polyzona]|nr:hypothetical protein C8Q77DRAFT_1158039 [Trametes polyzona]
MHVLALSSLPARNCAFLMTSLDPCDLDQPVIDTSERDELQREVDHSTVERAGGPFYREYEEEAQPVFLKLRSMSVAEPSGSFASAVVSGSSASNKGKGKTRQTHSDDGDAAIDSSPSGSSAYVPPSSPAPSGPTPVLASHTDSVVFSFLVDVLSLSERTWWNLPPTRHGQQLEDAAPSRNPVALPLGRVDDTMGDFDGKFADPWADAPPSLCAKTQNVRSSSSFVRAPTPPAIRAGKAAAARESASAARSQTGVLPYPSSSQESILDGGMDEGDSSFCIGRGWTADGW